MSPADDFGLGADAFQPPPPQATPAPKVFVRTLSTPSGMPWEQSRAAELEARHSAPMPMQDVALQMRRLAPWRPGAPGRFAALYVPMRAVGERLESEVTIDGVQVRVVFLSAAAKAAEQRRSLMVAVAAAACVAVAVAAVGTTFSRRDEAEARLMALETQASSRARLIAAQQRLRDQARLLDNAPGRGPPLSAALADLAWVSASKSSEAHVAAIHWEGGAMAIEARGEGPPLGSQGAWSIERAAKPIRRGLWLWIVKPARPDSGVDAPVAAEIRGGGR